MSVLGYHFKWLFLTCHIEENSRKICIFLSQFETCDRVILKAKGNENIFFVSVKRRVGGCG